MNGKKGFFGTCGILLFTVILTQNGFSSSSSKQIMRNIFRDLTELQPLMISKAKFESKKNEQKILSKLTNISSNFKQARHKEIFNRPGFSPSLQTVKEHIDETIDAFKGNHKPFAMLRLKSTTQLCMSCHGQVSEGHKGSMKLQALNVPRSIKNNSFLYAEYLALTGNYDRAQLEYFKTVDGWLENPTDLQKMFPKDQENLPITNQLFDLFKKVVIMNTKDRFNPKAATAFLKRYKNNEKVPRRIRKESEIWLTKLGEVSNSNIYKEINNDNEVAHLIKKSFKEDTDDHDLMVEQLAAGGFLLRYMFKNPDTSQAPAILYHASLSERQLHRSMFYSLSDLYLKECINKYTTSSYARKCFDEYEQNVIFGYTGSQGTDIPQDEKRELKELRKKVYK